MPENSQSITQIPFDERRYIAVISDNEFEKNRQNVKRYSYGDMLIDSIPLSVPGRKYITFFARLSAPYLILKANEAYSNYHANDKSLIQAIPMRDANKFKFLSGSAEVGRAYAANPLCDNVYYSVETYNDDLVDHKLSELERILNSLRAKNYRIIFQSDDSETGSGKIAAHAKGWLKLTGSASAEAEYHRERARRFERGGTSSGGEPSLPADLVWLDREPSWKALVESRLHYGREGFELRVTLDRDMRMSSKVQADLKALRLDTGATFEKRSNVALSVIGTF